MRRVYVAGPMTGVPEYNYPSFAAAEAMLTAQGWEVITPFHICDAVWQTAFGRNFNPKADRCEYADPLLSQMFRLDVDALIVSRAIALLDGWERSRGARLELAIAQMIGLEILSAETSLPLSPAAVMTSVEVPNVNVPETPYDVGEEKR